MPIETAEKVFFGVTALMVLIWLIGTRFAFSRLRFRSSEGGPDTTDGALEGEVLLQGQVESLEKKIAERLAAANSPLGSPLVSITECTPKRIAFERVRGVRGYGLTVFNAGVITLTREGGRTRVRYEVSFNRFLSTMRLVTYLVCFLYGGLFVLGVPLLIWHLVIHNDDPNIRGQVFQIFQMVHGVWPPFLMGALASRARKVTQIYFDTLLANLKFTA